jgi:hypothetical protein
MGEIEMSDLPTVQAEEYNPAKDPMHPYGKPCSVCSTEFEEEEWGTMGWLGILPVSFCVTCTTGIYNMVLQSLDVEEVEMILEEKRAEAAGEVTQQA